MVEIQAVFDWISSLPITLGLAVIALAAMTEYVFPPFPGDTVVIVAAVLVPNAQWPIWAVFSAVLVGSVLGAMLAFALGRWMQTRSQDHWLSKKLARPRVKERIDRVKQGFRKHGAAYIVINRFLPAFRSVFFVAAGLADLSPWKVGFFAALSAALWNAALMAVGWVVGYNLEELATWVQRWGLAVLAAVAVTGIFWWVRKKYRGKKNDDQ